MKSFITLLFNKYYYGDQMKYMRWAGMWHVLGRREVNGFGGGAWKKEQDGQCTCNVTLGCVRAATVAVKKQ